MSAGKLPEGWSETEIGDIADVISGGTPKSGIAENFALSGEGIAWLTPADLSGYKRKLISRGARDLSTEGYSSCSAKLMPAGAILFSSRAPIGYVAVASNEISTNQGFKSFVFTNDIYPDYAYYYLRNIRHLAEELGTGTTFKEISGSAAKTLPFVMAPLAEQKIIAEKLDTLLAQVDSTKARLEKIPQILKRFRQAVLTIAMSGGLTEEWRKNNSILFSSWVNSNIGELAQVATGKTPKRTEVKYWENGSIPWLTSSSTGEIYTEVAEQFITPIALKECTLKIFSPGTLLLAMYGEGKTRGQVTELKIHAACNQACAAIICDKEKIDLQFLKMRLMENYQETRKAAAGGNQPNLNLNKVREIPVIVPPLPEQQEIVCRVEQLFAYADTIEKQVNNALTRVNNLTQSILAKAFRGELTAQWRAENPDLISGENSAAALLEKIKAERAASGGKKTSRKKA
ncbi:TPA: restriction endonuclease subunit S [Salmonella enterica subsp. salamae serovar 9,46:z4,z24:z39:z42]|nr:restriction endonuclease subunit S [Salmonella enterica subsp. salamae serovar 9,46:z4,z24:z39:z42]HCM1955950.1 restriction endonuclease subunit S [Salmonella enterica subsp. salamae serovar 9,46:z4,z24:z39:z42]